MESASPARNSTLFESLQLRSLQLRNRIMLSPMNQFCTPDGVPDAWHFVHYGTRAVGGAAMIMTGSTAVSPEGRITPHDLGIWNDEQEQAFAPLTDFIIEQGAVPAIQLAHAGRKGSHARPWDGGRFIPLERGGWELLAPSPIARQAGDPLPRQIGAGEIAKVVDQFRLSAQRAARAGFLALEIHAAHGYLINQFLSPLSNQRQDAYGGNFEGRTRLLLEVVEAVREVWPGQLPLLVRLSLVEWVPGGWDLQASIRLAKILAGMGVDLIDCSSGGNFVEEQIPDTPGYQVSLSARLKEEAGIRTAAVGLISAPEMAEEIVATGKADLVALGRILLWDPYWPHHAASVLKAELRLPQAYARAGLYA